MTSANGNDAWSAFAELIFCELILHIGTRADKWSKQGAVKLIDTVDDTADAQSTKDDRAPYAWNESQRGISKECEQGGVGGIGAV